MFEKILFATTASPACDNAANVAFHLADKFNSRLFTFHVFGMPAHSAGPFSPDARSGEEEMLHQDYVEWMKEEMKNTYADLMETIDHCSVECTVGAPHTEILRKARKDNMDLIVMGAHTRQEDVGSERYRSIVGGTTRKVTREAPCPVLVVSRPCATCAQYFNTILFCTDFAKTDMPAFLFALDLARQIGCKLLVFHAVDLSYIHLGREEGQETIEKRVDAARKQIEHQYVKIMKGFDNYEIEIREGIPHVEILKFARQTRADLIIMSHHGRETDPDTAELGATIEQVALRSACPVASINRPDMAEKC